MSAFKQWDWDTTGICINTEMLSPTCNLPTTEVLKSKLPEITKPLNYKEVLPWHELHMELCQIVSRATFQDLKMKTFDKFVLPVMTYGAETLSLTQATASKLAE